MGQVFPGPEPSSCHFWLSTPTTRLIELWPSLQPLPRRLALSTKKSLTRSERKRVESSPNASNKRRRTRHLGRTSTLISSQRSSALSAESWGSEHILGRMGPLLAEPHAASHEPWSLARLLFLSVSVRLFRLPDVFNCFPTDDSGNGWRVLTKHVSCCQTLSGGGSACQGGATRQGARRRLPLHQARRFGGPLRSLGRLRDSRSGALHASLLGR